MSGSSVDRAVAAIRRLVLARELLPGERLMPERQLAERLGLSRATVREAVRQLNESGLLESRARSGTYVADIDVSALFEVRRRLEPLAAALAASSRTSAEAAELKRLMGELRASRDDAPRFAELDEQLHRAVWRAARNPILLDLLERLADLGGVSRGITVHDADTRSETLAQLATLVAAIRRRDPALAEAAMTTHIASVQIGAEAAAAAAQRAADAWADEESA